MDPRFVKGRREEGHARHPRYYALNPQASDRKLRVKTWEHYYADVKRPDTTTIHVRFRVAETTRIHFRLPAGRDLYPVLDVFAPGTTLRLTPSPRLRKALPDVDVLVVTVTEVGLTGAQRKTGYIIVSDMDARFVAQVINAV